MKPKLKRQLTDYVQNCDLESEHSTGANEKKPPVSKGVPSTKNRSMINNNSPRANVFAYPKYKATQYLNSASKNVGNDTNTSRSSNPYGSRPKTVNQSSASPPSYTIKGPKLNKK